jgi:homoserine kinase
LKKVCVRVPATTANLGPGFGSLGLALDLWNEAEFFQAKEDRITISIQGEGTGTLPIDETNAILGAALQLYALV